MRISPYWFWSNPEPLPELEPEFILTEVKLNFVYYNAALDAFLSRKKKDERFFWGGGDDTEGEIECFSISAFPDDTYIGRISEMFALDRLLMVDCSEVYIMRALKETYTLVGSRGNYRQTKCRILYDDVWRLDEFIEVHHTDDG